MKNKYFAFGGCSGIAEVFGGELVTIGAYAFSGCLGVKKFNMSNANELNIRELNRKPHNFHYVVRGKQQHPLLLFVQKNRKNCLLKPKNKRKIPKNIVYFLHI